MIDIWNTPEWKAKSKRNVDIKSKSTETYTWLSNLYDCQKKAAKILERDPKPHEMWKQSHCRKGSRPLDKDLSSSSSLVSDVDLDENIEEENPVWVDDRAKETWVKYDGYLVEKYWDERSNHPKFDELNEIIKEILKEKEEEVEKEILNEIIAELEARKEKHKAEKVAISNRMSKIENMLKTLARKSTIKHF
ncbi:hypothetical protein R6Q57_029830 [Mikania cordata]